LVGLELEASSGPIKADKSEALRAFKFSYASLNAFPDWCEDLVEEHLDVFTKLSDLKIRSAFDDKDVGRQHAHSDLCKIAYSGKAIRDLLAPVFLSALIARIPRNLSDLEIAVQIVSQAKMISTDKLMPVLRQGFEDAFVAFRFSESWIWLDAIFQVKAEAGWELLVASLGSDWQKAAGSLFTRFMGRDRRVFSKVEEFSEERFDLGGDLVVLRQALSEESCLGEVALA
jgi:hypothetical protein